MVRASSLLTAKRRDEAVEVFNATSAGADGALAGAGLLREAGVLVALKELGTPIAEEQLAVLMPPRSNGTLTSEQFLALFERAAAAAEGGALVGMSQLWDAAKRDQGELVQKLIHAGCDPCVTDGRGWTVLHHAARWGRSAIVNSLLELIAAERLELDRGDTSGWTPLMSAAAAGHTETVEILLGAGAAVDATSAQGRSALHWAAGKGRIAVLEVLLERGGDELVECVDKGGWTPLHLALLHGQLEASQLLVENGASLAQLDLCERDALSYCTGAAKTGDEEGWTALVAHLEQLAEEPKAAREARVRKKAPKAAAKEVGEGVDEAAVEEAEGSGGGGVAEAGTEAEAAPPADEVDLSAYLPAE